MDPELEQFMRIKPKPLAPRARRALADQPTALAAAPAGGLVAAGTYSDEIEILDEDLNLIASLEGHTGGCTALAFAAGGALLVSAGEDGCAAVWAVGGGGGGALKARLPAEGVDADRTPDGHTVGCVAVSPDGSLAACAAGKTVHLFEPAAEDIEATRRVFPPVAGGVVTDVRFAGPRRLLAAHYGGVVLYGAEPGEGGLALEHGVNILSVAATPDLRWIVGGCMDSTVHIWNVERRAPGERPALAGGAGAGAAAGAAAPAAAAAAPGPVGEGAESAAAQPGGGGGGSGGREDEDEDESEGGSGSPPAPVSILEGPDGAILEVVTRVDFGASLGGAPLLASCGGNACLVWDFGGPGPAGGAPTVALGHTKPVQCQCWHPTKPGVMVTGGRDGRLLLFETYNAADGMEEGMPALCGPAAVDPAPSGEEVVAVAWGSGGALISAHANGDVKSWSWLEG
ncbi:MAG: WD40-repeat-containing domain protein [Monoraphidium minutum]|nr:MAG: WD40-repeat-containing domain protein [Monoraphidium minutum]